MDSLSLSLSESPADDDEWVCETCAEFRGQQTNENPLAKAGSGGFPVIIKNVITESQL